MPRPARKPAETRTRSTKRPLNRTRSAPTETETEPKTSTKRKRLAEDVENPGTRELKAPSRPDPLAIAKQERERVKFIESYRGRIADDKIIDKMIDGNVTVEAARTELNEIIVQELQETAPVRPNHQMSRGEGQRSIQVLQASLLMRMGIEPSHPAMRTTAGQRMLADPSCGADWLVSGVRGLRRDGSGQLSETVDKAFDKAYSLRHVSMMTLCRSVLEALGQRVSSLAEEEIIQRAVSTSQLQQIFTTAFNASFLIGFSGTPDTTGWVRRIDLPNFQPAERIQMGKYARLTRRTRGNTADQGTIDAKAELMRVFEYASKFIVDEQDIVDDRFGAINQMTPEEMGQAAAELAPDLVYGTLLANPTLGSDSTALFHSNHGNLASTKPLTSDNLSDAASLMDSQILAGTVNRLIGVTAKYLITSPTQRANARTLVRSEEIRDTTTSTKYGTANPNRDAFEPVIEPRLRVGVEHPETGATIAGEPNNWYLADAQGRYGLELAFLSGRSRAPRVRRLTNLNDGYAMGWNIDHVVGCGAVGYEGVFKRVAS